MPGTEDWLNRPLDIIQGLFDINDKSWSDKVTDYFTKKLQDKGSLDWLPSLNHTSLHLLKPNAMVRFRCMIQDMYDPEFYLGAYEVVDKNTGQTTMKSGMFQDLAECSQHQQLNLESSRNITLDRQTFYCVPVPAETDWIKQSRHQTSDPSTSQSSRVKRALEADDTTPSSAQLPNPDQSGNHGTGVSMETADGNQSEKRTKRSEVTGQESLTSVDLNFPLSEEKGPACMVKVYNNFESFRVNDIVEFIGVLSVDPELANLPGNDQNGGVSSAIDGSDTMDGIEEQTAHAPPPSLVPRLHAIVSHKLQHVNPLLPVSLASEEGKTFVQSMMGECSSVRDQLRCLLQQLLFGDALAADYLLLNLVSSVYARQDVVALGKFTLNLIGCQESGFSQTLQGLLSQLVTKSHLLPLSLQNMNTLRLTPKKDYTANRLKSGLLQLSDRTHLVLDETALQPGQLDANGVRNLAAIGNAISWQKVDYDFEFHKTEFKTNLVFVVTSEGKSLLPNDCQVSIQPKTSPSSIADIQAGIQRLISAGSVNLNRIRTYLGVIPFISYNITEEMSKIVEQDFVEARKRYPNQMTQEDFHSLLVVARLLSLSMGHASLTRDVWERTKRMEQERKIRLKSETSH